MSSFSLACDYDETLASRGTVAPPVIEALIRFRASGAKLVLITGRELADLAEVGPDLGIFDFVIAENGAVLYRPENAQAQSLAGPPPAPFIACLRQRGVAPLAVGRSIVATVERNAAVVQRTIAEMALDLEVIRNRSSLMVLPRGVNKGTGLRAALEKMKLPAKKLIGIGDAENDAAFLALCGMRIAVANAIPSIQKASDWVTHQPCGAGVVEIIDRALSGRLCAAGVSPSP